MPAWPLGPVRRHGARGAKVVGVAGLVLAFAPVASSHASPTGKTTDAPATPADTTATPHATVKRHAGPVAPNYGFMKVRVGVQIKTGAYVPLGTTTTGSTVTLTETGPNAVTPLVSTCVTDATTQVGTTTYCTTFDSANPGVRRAALRRAAAAVGKLTARMKAQLTDPGSYTALPGDSVAITQTTVGDAALVLDPVAQTAPPCVVPDVGTQACDDPDVIFTDNGLPPLAVGDTVTLTDDTVVDLDVLDNDETHGAPATIASVVQPAHGHVTIESPTLDPTLSYTPAAGFSGADPFSYVLSTANGTSTATVDVTVTAASTTSASTTPPTVTTTPTTVPTTQTSAVGATSTSATSAGAVAVASSTSSTGALPNTGGHVQREAETGFGLVGIGALLTMIGVRRRPRGTHAG